MVFCALLIIMKTLQTLQKGIVIMIPAILNQSFQLS